MNKFPMIVLSLSALMLASCASDNTNKHEVTFHLYDDVTNVVEVKHNTTVAKPTNPERDGFLFSGWFTSLEGSEEFYFGTKIVSDLDIYAHWSEDIEVTTEMLAAALNRDYSNSQVTYDTTAEIKDSFMVTNYDGYNIVETMVNGQGLGDYLYYHDYNNESYLFFSGEQYKDYGDAWVRKGLKTESGSYINLGIDNTYFQPRFNLSCYDANDFVYRAGLFILAGQEKVQKATQKGAFNYIFENDVAQVAIVLDETNTYVSKIITYDSEDINDERCTVTTIFNINAIDAWRLSTLPTAPNETNTKTWYEWRNEEEPTYDNLITSINLELVGDAKSSIVVDKKFNIHYTFNPIKPDRKNIEILVDGPKDGLDVSYDFGDQLLQGKAYLSGTYHVSLHDTISDVTSNLLEVVVKDVKDSSFNYDNCLYDLEVDFDTNNNPTLYNYVSEENVAEVSFSKQCAKAVKGFEGTTNVKFGQHTPAIRFDLATADGLHAEGRTSFATFALDKEVNAFSFTYGALFQNQISNAYYMSDGRRIDSFKAYIEVSTDGNTWTDAEDWTDELMNNLTGYTTRRKDIKFNSNVKFVRISFDNLTCNQGCTIVADTFSFYLNK